MIGYYPPLKKLLLFICFFFFLSLSAQNKITPAKEKFLNNPTLRELQTLLLQWQSDRCVWDAISGEEWEQDKIKVDEKTGEIIYRIRPLAKNNKPFPWKITYHIAIMGIRQITGDRQATSIRFLTEPGAVLVVEGDNPQPSAMTNEQRIYFHYSEARNLPGQLGKLVTQYQSGLSVNRQ